LRNSRVVALALAVGIVPGRTAATVLEAQPTGIKRTLLMKKELAGIDGREVYLGTAEIAPGANAGRHFHDGHEIGYVLEGMAVLEIEGPDADQPQARRPLPHRRHEATRG
jgi:quercetin dioxygenase-like cupin family protein